MMPLWHHFFMVQFQTGESKIASSGAVYVKSINIISSMIWIMIRGNVYRDRSYLRAVQ